MKKSVVIFFSAFFSITLFGQSADETSIRKILADQTMAWNQGNIDSFMQGYWHNDSLSFIGKSGITYGYKNTLDNYKKNYSDAAKTGRLFFKLISLRRLSADYYFVTGQWFLKRTVGDVEGYYTLLFKKIRGQWMIISDHSS